MKKLKALWVGARLWIANLDLKAVNRDIKDIQFYIEDASGVDDVELIESARKDLLIEQNYRRSLKKKIDKLNSELDKL